jgi:hypothetical protein
MKFVALSEQKEWHGAGRTRPKAEQMASSCCVVSRNKKRMVNMLHVNVDQCDAIVVITDRGRLGCGLVCCWVFVHC